MLRQTVRFRRSDRVDETRVGDQVVLYHRDNGTGVVLNPTGSIIWDSLVAPQSADELARGLTARFPATPAERIAADVGGYLAALVEQRLVTGEST